MAQDGAEEFVVFLVDDDRAVLRALTRLLATQGYLVRPFESARDFLLQHDPAVPGCVVLDVSMPGLNGIELQQKLLADGAERPIVFITAVGDVPVSVKAMKAGAVDFLTKPVKSDDLFAAISAARDKGRKARERRTELENVEGLLASLTSREKEVLTGVLAGQLNKQIAASLGIAIKTVKVHRGRMMKKMSVRTVAQLVHLVDTVGFESTNDVASKVT